MIGWRKNRNMKIRCTRAATESLIEALESRLLLSFSVGERVVTVGTTACRSIASTSGTDYGDLPAGQYGTIQQGPTLNQGFEWYLVNWDNYNFGLSDGWSAGGSPRFVSANVTPSITSVSPSQPIGSNSAQDFYINGSNFQSGCTVTLRDLTTGEPPFTNRTIYSQSTSQILIKPNFTTAAHNWSVEVINPGNASSGQYHFSVISSAPSITSVLPGSFPASNSNQTLTINGSNFQSGATLTFVPPEGGSIASNSQKLTFVSSSQITYQFNNAGDSGGWSVRVNNPDGQSSSVIGFTVTAVVLAPSISGVSPTSMAPSNSNQMLTINGSNFQSGATLTFVPPEGGTIASNSTKLTFVSSSQITYQFNNGSDSGPWTVRVNNPDGQSSVAVGFSVDPPSVQGFYLTFPLAGKNAYNAQIISVFDHSMTTPYSASGGVTAYTGEVGLIQDPIEPPAGANKDLFSYDKPDSSPFIVNGGHYIGTSLTGSATLNYDGHPGYDYVASSGTNVYADADGTVHYPTIFPGVPNAATFHTLAIDHGNGYITYYLHLSTYPMTGVAEGTHVARGDLIGLSGSAGVSGAHLHYEIQYHNVPVDPYGWTGSGQDPYTRGVNVNLWTGVVVPAPSIVSLSPTSFPASNSNQTLTINGSNFQSGTTLTFVPPEGGTIASNPAKLTFVSNSQITYEFNNANDSGEWSVKVNNPDGQSSAAVPFTVMASPGTKSGVDYHVSSGTATTGVDVAAIKAAGKQFVGEYIGVTENSGYLRPEDVVALAGLDIVSLFERTPTSASYFTLSNADFDAADAIAAAIKAGQPSGSAIYFTVDFDPGSDSASLSAIDNYFREIRTYFNANSPNSYKIGVYGPGDILPMIMGDPSVGASYSWWAQPFGTAGANFYPSANLAQTQDSTSSNPIVIGGVRVDLDEAYTVDFGQWSNSTPAQPSSPSPVNGTTLPNVQTLDWSDAANASSYDVYLDDVLLGNTVDSKWSLSGTLSLGSHAWHVIAKNATGSTAGPNWTFTVQQGQQTVVLQPGPTTSKDIWTTSYYSYADGGSTPGGGKDDDTLRVGGVGDTYQSLLQFDLTGMPAHAYAATLSLYVSGFNNLAPVGMYLDRITQAWDWKTQSTGRDHDRLWWADRPATTQWATDPLPAPSQVGWYTIDLTSLYNAWKEGTVPNDGIQLRPVSILGYFNIFLSSEYVTDPSLRPKLSIDAALPADANGDRAVDFNDLVILAQNYNTSGGKTWSQGDFTGDGNVDFNDLVKLAQNYNTALPGAPVPSSAVSFNSDLAAAFALSDSEAVPAKPRAAVIRKPKPAAVVRPPVGKRSVGQSLMAEAGIPISPVAPVPLFGTKPIKSHRRADSLFAAS